MKRRILFLLLILITRSVLADGHLPDPDIKKYDIEDMVKEDVIFCATGVTDGDFLKGITDNGDYYDSETLILHASSKINKIFKNKTKK